MTLCDGTTAKPQVRGGWATGAAKITQIYAGTNQVQRIVMARQLLNGVQSRL